MKVSWVQTTVEGVLIGDTSLPGPTVGIMGGVHGNETSGYSVVSELMKTELDIACGSVILIIGNPRAIEKNVRLSSTAEYVNVQKQKKYNKHLVIEHTKIEGKTRFVYVFIDD